MQKTTLTTLKLITAAALLAACSDNSGSAPATPQAMEKQAAIAKKEFPNKLWRLSLQKTRGEEDYDESKTPDERQYEYMHNDEYRCQAAAQKNADGKFVITRSICIQYDGDQITYDVAMGLIRVEGDKATYIVDNMVESHYVLSNDPQDPSPEEIVRHARENKKFL